MESDRQLSDMLSEFARTVVTDFPVQAILDHLVLRIVDLLPIDAAGVTLIAPGISPAYLAASDDSALRYEEIQTELHQGPCLVAFHTGQAVMVPDLNDDDRFPEFSARALAEGLKAVFTFPLRQGANPLGALDLYRTTPGPLNSWELTAAQTLADVVAAYLLNAKAREDLLESAEQARQTALHDSLTGLPNRTLLIQRLEHAILRCRRSGKLVSILFVDLDRFKAVNDNYGHHVGDELLIAVAQRITGMLRPGDTLSRISGDEFVILCEDLDTMAQVERLAARVGTAMSEPFDLTTTEVLVSASVGITFAGPGGGVPEQMLRDADAAMFKAKRGGGARHGLADLRERGLAEQRAGLSRDLRGAGDRGELRAVYQPIVSTSDGSVTAVEALVRWAHPTLGTVLPDVVVPLAEQSGAIVEVGLWMLGRACTDRELWRSQESAASVQVSVNVSARQLVAPKFVDSVADVLARTGTAPTAVTLEVTESVFIQNGAQGLGVLQELKQLGVRIALDDFGTGYSSLSYLQRFPVDIVKMDRSFIADLHREPAGRLIVNAIVVLAHGLGMTVVAEGVEDPEQLDDIVALGCDAYQGFYFAEPKPAEEVIDLLARGAGAHLQRQLAFNPQAQ